MVGNIISMGVFGLIDVFVVLFILGIIGLIVVRKNVIMILIFLEVILLSVTLSFIIFSVYLDDLVGEVFALLNLVVAGAESAIGLALLVVYYRLRGVIMLESVNMLKG